MNKEEALEEFFRFLKISYNIACLYSKDHPYFLKSVKDLKEKTDMLLQFLNPINIGITTSSLAVDGKTWKKAGLHDEIANMLHSRKIKSIEIRQGLTLEELISFMGKASLRPKEILRAGGISKALSKEKTSHLFVEELDYSSLLRSEGEEIKDIWVYLLQEAVERKDPQEIDKLADNLASLLGRLKAKDFLEDEQLQQHLVSFLQYLKDHRKDKFEKCVTEILGSILKDKAFFEDKSLKNLRVFIQDLSADELADVIWDKILTDGDFDALSFKLFSQLSEEKKHQEIAISLAGKLEKADNPQIRKKVQNLFFVPNSSIISEVYRNTLSSLLKHISFEDKFLFDRRHLEINYHFILLNLLSETKDRQSLSQIVENIYQDWDKITEARDWEYLKYLLDILKQRKKEDPSLKSIFESLDKHLSNFIESLVWEVETPPELEAFIDALEVSSLNFNLYLERIFNENKINPYILKLFLKFFPQNLAKFCENLEKKHTDIEFLAKIIQSLGLTGLPLAVEVLKTIFSFVNELLKIEVLKAMQNLPTFDAKFLFSILKEESVSLRKEALVILAKDERVKKEAIARLLCIKSPWGIKNKIILQNLGIIEEVGLEEAREYVNILSKRRFFWNRNIKKKSKDILRNWDVRKS